MHVSRRNVLIGTGAIGLVHSLPALARAGSSQRARLPIPAELRADQQNRIAITAQTGERSFLLGTRTPTMGFSAPYLGPAIRVRRGDSPTVALTNNLNEAITLHWHGLIIPGKVDGGPYQLIQPGMTSAVKLPIDQPAATLWFHPHVYPVTAELVVNGLAGLFIVDDEESGALGLPSTWGVDDIPLVLQDRRFQSDGRFFHRFNAISVAMGYVGDTMLVNGAHDPVAVTAKGWLRFRLLNGSNARNYTLAVSDNRPMYIVATDGGLLEAPVERQTVSIAPGERYEVLVDARNGAPFELVSLPVERPAIMRLPPFDAPLRLLTVKPDGAEGSGTLPDALVSLPPLPAQRPAVSQKLVMQMYRDAEGQKMMMETGLMAMARSGVTDPAVVARVVELITTQPPLPLKTQLTTNGINGTSFSFIQKGFHVPINTDVVWSISEESDRMLHPVHIHGCQFRIISLNGNAPPDQMKGWKDTVPIDNAGSAEILVRFPCEAPVEYPYMAHCHNLEHEDSGMMTEFSVS